MGWTMYKGLNTVYKERRHTVYNVCANLLVVYKGGRTNHIGGGGLHMGDRQYNYRGRTCTLNGQYLRKR